MDSRFFIREGNPLSHRQLERLKKFLIEQDLRYDIGITYSIIIENEEDEIIGTGSYQDNVLKCIAVAKEYQGMGLLANIITRLIHSLVNLGENHIFLFTKPQNLKMFTEMSFYPIIKTTDVLLMENKKDGISNYIDQLKMESNYFIDSEKNKKEVNIGAIVANCNPFTKGHQYLIEKASKMCDWLHIFVLSKENGLFSSESRYQMVKDGTSHLNNVILHQTSKYIVSSATFPTYFIKDKVQAENANCILDLKIFEQYIAKELYIKKRFVGTEPFCTITNKYNETMKSYFEGKDIEIIEIPRLENTNGAISASKARKLILEKQWDELKNMLPLSTLNILKSTYKHLMK